MYMSRNVSKHTKRVALSTSVLSRQSKVDVVVSVIIMESIVLVNARLLYSVERKLLLARRLVIVESSVSRNVQSFVSRNAFMKDYLENGFISANSLQNQNHSLVVSHTVQDISRQDHVLIIVQLSRYLASIANVFV